MISSNSLVLLACVAVAVVLVLGLFNMMRGGSANLSQKLMRLRVLLQFLAIIFIMGVVWWRSAWPRRAGRRRVLMSVRDRGAGAPSGRLSARKERVWPGGLTAQLSPPRDVRCLPMP